MSFEKWNLKLVGSKVLNIFQKPHTEASLFATESSLKSEFVRVTYSTPSSVQLLPITEMIKSEFISMIHQFRGWIEPLL